MIMFDWVSQKIAQKLCNHKYGEVKDGYQYCEYCNLARKVPEFTKNSGTCTHPKWEVVEAYKLQQVDRRDGSKTTTGEVRI